MSTERDEYRLALISLGRWAQEQADGVGMAELAGGRPTPQGYDSGARQAYLAVMQRVARYFGGSIPEPTPEERRERAEGLRQLARALGYDEVTSNLDEISN